MEQAEQPPAKKTSFSGEGEPLGVQTAMPPEITVMHTEVMTTTTSGVSTGTEITTTDVPMPIVGVTTVTMTVVSEGVSVTATTSKEADSTEQGTSTKAGDTGTTSTVLFTQGELHQEGGPASQSSGVSQESVLSGEPRLLGTGCGRGVRPTMTPAVKPRESAGHGESHDPQPGTSGENRGPTLGPSGDQQESARDREVIKDLEDEVDSLTGINNNLEMELESHKVLLQEYEEDHKKLKLENATNKTRLLMSKKKNEMLQRLLLEAEGKLREAGLAELETEWELEESWVDQLVLLQVSLEAYKRALNNQIANYSRLRMYTLAIEKILSGVGSWHFEEQATASGRSVAPVNIEHQRGSASGHDHDADPGCVHSYHGCCACSRYHSSDCPKGASHHGSAWDCDDASSDDHRNAFNQSGTNQAEGLRFRSLESRHGKPASHPGSTHHDHSCCVSYANSGASCHRWESQCPMRSRNRCADGVRYCMVNADCAHICTNLPSFPKVQDEHSSQGDGRGSGNPHCQAHIE